MATEVTAWKAEDGTLHDNECQAATRDVEIFVSKSPLAENQPFARKLVEWLTSEAPAIRKKLEAHERACPRAVAADDPEHASYCQSHNGFNCDCGEFAERND